MLKKLILIYILCFSIVAYSQVNKLKLNSLEYLEMQGLNVMLAHDFYPESHQGGVGIIQNGIRVATNGDIRLEATPGQWQPVPAVGTRVVNKEREEISVRMSYPDESKHLKGFNPIVYPDLNIVYHVRVVPEGQSFRITVDFENEIPESWAGKIGFNMEFFPQVLFGKSFYMDNQFGIFPRQLNGPMEKDADGVYQTKALAVGKKLVIAPESEEQRITIEAKKGENLYLIDGRAQHNNGWYVVRSLVPTHATKNAIEWIVTPNVIPNWKSEPVIQLSQIGYHTKQQKTAVIELDKHESKRFPIRLYKISPTGEQVLIKEQQTKDWGFFLRYNYVQLDFTEITDPGMYLVKYDQSESLPFQISPEVLKRHVWQPTLEYFLPAQMCHMKVNDRYKVWHGFCHLDDARMAPTDLNHFDGYLQGKSTLCDFKSGDHVHGLDRGGWHDAGDFDLRIESQAQTIHGLSLAYEEFKPLYDNTSINQFTRIVEIQTPDNKPDILQQIEHGALSIVGGYLSMNRLYRGIICPTLRQYVLLGDPINMTDNIPFQNDLNKVSSEVGLPGSPDDRWVFTEDNPQRELETAAALAATSRALKGFNDTLSVHSLAIAKVLWNVTKETNPLHRVRLAVELYKTTKEKIYSDFILKNASLIASDIEHQGWIVGPILKEINNKKLTKQIRDAVLVYKSKVENLERKTPFGLPYEPDIWGAGWGIQAFGVEQYYFHTSYPDIFPDTYMLHAMNFILGCHPGSNTSSFASGIGAKSLTVAYGFNRDDWSYIPGGICSGTALIRPDFPELLVWPYLWQQTEYVLGGGTTDYLFLILAADKLLSQK